MRSKRLCVCNNCWMTFVKKIKNWNESSTWIESSNSITFNFDFVNVENSNRNFVCIIISTFSTFFEFWSSIWFQIIFFVKWSFDFFKLMCHTSFEFSISSSSFWNKKSRYLWSMYFDCCYILIVWRKRCLYWTMCLNKKLFFEMM